MKLFYILFVFILCFAAHPIEKMSVGELTYVNKELKVSLRLFEEDLQPILKRNGMHPEVSFRDYMTRPFDDKILPSIETYVKANLELSVDEIKLVPRMKKVDWVTQNKFSDHAAIAIEMTYPCEKIEKVKVLKVKNSLMMAVYGQINILHVNVAGHSTVFNFERDKEMCELVF